MKNIAKVINIFKKSRNKFCSYINYIYFRSMKLIIDLDKEVLKALEIKAKKVNRKRKPYIELLCINDAKKK